MVASYRKAMVAQRKLILNTGGSSNTTTTNSANTNNTNLANLNILPPPQNLNSLNSNVVMIVDEDGNGNGISSSRKKTGRPVGRPKSKDKQ